MKTAQHLVVARTGVQMPSVKFLQVCEALSTVSESQDIVAILTKVQDCTAETIVATTKSNATITTRAEDE